MLFSKEEAEIYWQVFVGIWWKQLRGEVASSRDWLRNELQIIFMHAFRSSSSPAALICLENSFRTDWFWFRLMQKAAASSSHHLHAWKWKYHPQDIGKQAKPENLIIFSLISTRERIKRWKLSFHPHHDVNRTLPIFTLALFAAALQELKSASRFQFLIIYFIKWIRCCFKRFFPPRLSRLWFRFKSERELFMLKLEAFSLCAMKWRLFPILPCFIDVNLGFPLVMQANSLVLSTKKSQIRF